LKTQNITDVLSFFHSTVSLGDTQIPTLRHSNTNNATLKYQPCDTQIPTLRHFCFVFCFVAELPADGEDVTALSTPLIKRIIFSTSLSLSSVDTDVELADVEWLAACGDPAGDWWWSTTPDSDWFFRSFYTSRHIHSLLANSRKLPRDTTSFFCDCKARFPLPELMARVDG